MRLRLIALVSALSAVALLPGSAGLAAPPGPPAIDRPNEIARWQGPSFGLASGARPEICTPETCHEQLVFVELASDFFQKNPGALEFAIRWPSEYDDFDLYVYRPDGSLVSSVQSNIGSAESAFDREPVNGSYRVVTTAKNVTDSAFEGMAQFEPKPVYRGRTRDLLPNLKTAPPRHFHLVAPVFYQTGTPLEVGEARPLSCYPDEIVENLITRCLRFDNVIENVGDADLRMRFKIDGTVDDPRIEQVISRTDGSVRNQPAGEFTFHAAHGHYHYEGFAHYQLFSINFSRRTVSPLGEGVKSGFCLEDTELTWWGRRGNGPMGITFPDCDLPAYQDDEGVWGLMGITRGWADVYTWDLPDQFISIEGMADGLYVLQSTADSAKVLFETRENDNQAWSLIRIRGNEVDVLAEGRGPAKNALSYYRP
jgi:hypothetical protein